MLTYTAIVAYSAACTLALLAFMANWHAMQVPWLMNKYEDSIFLWKFVSDSLTVEFPGRHICRTAEAFCAAWRTATFLLTLALLPESLIFLAILFSWAFHHRKKTVVVVRYLIVLTLLLQFIGMVVWLSAFSQLDNVLSGSWNLVGGWYFVAISNLSSVSLFTLIIRFRTLVRTAIENDIDSDSSFSDEAYRDDISDDEISVPDSIPPEQVDFYIFNKQARRRELARLGG